MPSPDVGRRRPRIQKEDLYMLMALWMEESPWAIKATDKQIRPVGAVFVKPNGWVLSVDCSRSNDCGTVHGAIRALIKYPDQVERCHVYLSRQPCAHCVKMLVQAQVSKVMYLPLKPEKDDAKENKSVDALFKVSTVSREVYVPDIAENTFDEEKGLKHFYKSKNRYGYKILKPYENIASKVDWDNWKENILETLDWEEYSDDSIVEHVEKDMKRFFEWFDLGIQATGTDKVMRWEKYVLGRGVAQEEEQAGEERGAKTQTVDDSAIKNARGEEQAEDRRAERQPEDEEQPLNQKDANHLSRLAQLLSYCTDDPITGVGCVITYKDEIVSIGWNGFPSKALYGNHPRRGRSKHSRASKDSKDPKDSEDNENIKEKYPHLIHAEQNALIRRNKNDLKGTTAYVTRIPCNECLPMLYDRDVKTFVLPHFHHKEKKESETAFFEILERKDKLTVFRQVRKPTADEQKQSEVGQHTQ